MKSAERSPIQKTQDLGVEFWNDSCALGELAEAVAQGAVGATSNPVIVGSAYEADRDLWGAELDVLISKAREASEADLAWGLIELIAARSAALLEPAFRASKGAQGRLCLQVHPGFYRSPKRMVAQARHFAALAPNIAVKIPAVEGGLRAVEELTALGIPVNATVSFTLAQAVAVAEAAERGLERAKFPVQPYVTLMVGRLDDHLKRSEPALDPSDADWAGIAVFKKAAALFKERGYRAKLLSAAYRHAGHWTELIGPGVVQSIPYAWWTKFNALEAPSAPTLEDPIHPKVLRSLQACGEFRKAYDERGLAPADFIGYGASLHTLDQFNAAYHKLLDSVRSRIAGR